MTAKKEKKSLLKHSIEIILIIIVAILIRSTLYEPYVVPSSSMLPNLLIGDRIIVNKYIYGISNHSFPFSPNFFKGRFLPIKKPKRGDIVVFETDKVYVKRLIGLPGDKVQVLDGSLYINDIQVPKTLTYPFVNEEGINIPQYIETLPENVSHTVLDFRTNSTFDNTEPYIVPEDRYFFMGDNRDNSRDSRDISGDIGFVHYENLLGKVTKVFFSAEEVTWYNIPNILLTLRSDRFFHSLVD